MTTQTTTPVEGKQPRPGSRAARMRQPVARAVVEAAAVDHGVCIRPIGVRRINTETGESSVIDLPCGSTLAAVCPSCAERKKRLRAAQCREGWHLDTEPVFEPNAPTEEQRYLVELRAGLTKERDEAAASGGDTREADTNILTVDNALRATGVRGSVERATGRRARSTKRRQDAPDLPTRAVAKTTLGKAYKGSGGKTFRPSMFVTLTLPSYGRVTGDGTPVKPAMYDYARAARDALHFSKLIDRFVQNLRRVAGFEVQYFATVEPQRRLAPHLHLAMRGTISRAELRQIVAATYHQVWWPPTDRPVYVGDRMPVWAGPAKGYVDPGNRQPLPTWNEALDTLGDEPAHVARFGTQLDAQGVIAGTPEADRCVRYLTKYLTKAVDECHEAESDQQRQHVERLAAALRFEPCSPTCPNWLRYGTQPKGAKPEQRPGSCKSKAHKQEHLGYAGRRVLVSRKWSGKTLTDHRHDQHDWITEALGLSATQPADPKRFTWELLKPGDEDLAPLDRRLLHAIATRQQQHQQLETTLTATGPPDLSATEHAEDGRAA